MLARLPLRSKLILVVSIPLFVMLGFAGVGIMLPVGVARVLVGDLVAANAVTVDVGAQDAANDVALLERLLDGIRAL